MSTCGLIARFGSAYTGKLLRKPIILCSIASFAAYPYPYSGPPLPRAHRIYVSTIGDKPNASGTRRALIEQLRKAKDFEVVNSPSQADAVLDGETEIYIRGYVSFNARAGTSPANGKPVYGGYVSIELKNRSGETIWSYLSTLREPSTNPPPEIAKDVIKHLIAGEALLEKKPR